MEITDNGIGFDPTAPPKTNRVSSGLGLPSIHEQASRIGGKIEIDTAPGEGTRVLISVPLTESASKKELS
jgi:signal transduction histidine kinase